MTDILKERQQLITRLGMLKTERTSWMSHWQELSEVFLPRSGRYFVQDRNKGQKRHQAILDGTTTKAARVLAAGMMAGMNSPARPWFRLTTPDEDLNKSPAVKEWLAQVTRLMLAIFGKSNTYRSLHSGYEELGVFGTWSSILMDDFKNVIHSYPLTIGEFMLAQNWKGEVDTLYREFQKTVRELVAEFGYASCSSTVQGLYDTGRLDAWVTVVHCIEPRSDRDHTKRDAKNMAWRSVYFELSGQSDKFLRESGFKEFPALAARWGAVGGDIYGNSPGMDALGDARQLQHEQRRKAQGIDKLTNPPLQAPTSLKNRDVEMLPGGITFVDQLNGGIKSLYDVRIDLSHLLEDIQDVRQRIRDAFFSDLFLMLANSTNTTMTATEVAERHEEKLLILGPTTERMHSEIHSPLVEHTFARIVESGICPPPPPEMQGMDLNVEFVSMLAQAQRAVGTKSIDVFVGNLGAVAQFKPGVLDKFNADEWADRYSDMLGIDPELIVSADGVALIRQQRAQAQQQAQQAALMNQNADTAAKLGGIDTGGKNAATDIMGMFSGYSA